MECLTKIDIIEDRVIKIFQRYPGVAKIIEVLHNKGAKLFLVGGTVRDLVLNGKKKNMPDQDIDIEVHNIVPEELEKILSQLGPVRLVGKSFGVFKIDKLPIDWSIPRTDLPGRKPVVTLNPGMGIVKALERRDLTMNAMAINLKNYEFIDPFKGCKDIDEKTLRSPNPQFFSEDPLRVYRVMQFISRFEMNPDEKLNEASKQTDISSVSQERICEEFSKMLLKSIRPSLGIRWLKSIGRLAQVLPELASTIGVAQEPDWHPEGDVFEHSMQALDAAAQFDYSSEWEKLIVLYAALLHDLGKVSHTQLIKGKLRSFGHDQAGEPLAYKLLYRLTRNKVLSATVSNLVRWHMQPVLLVKQNAKAGAYKRLAHKLAARGATMKMLAFLSLADNQGRNGEKNEPLDSLNPHVQTFIDKAHNLNIWEKPLEPLMSGNDLLKYTKPGPYYGKILEYAYQEQIEKGIESKEELIERVLKKFKLKG